MASFIDFPKERDSLIKYVNALSLPNELKKHYQKQIRYIFVNLQSGEYEKGISFLCEIESRLQSKDRGPISDFLKRIQENKSSSIMKKTEKTDVDLAVICALKDPELDQILNLLTNCLEIRSNEKNVFLPHTYYLGEFRSSDRTIKVVAAHQNRTGMVDCAILVSKIIHRWNPMFIAMTGVCGGRKSSHVRLGDIIVPNSVFTYQSGKHTDKGFERELKVVNINSGLIQRVQACANSVIPYEIGRAWPGTRHDPPIIRTESLACGEVVINKRGMLEKDIAVQDRKVIGVDMESYALIRSAQLCSEYRAIPIVIKSVMDYTEDKSDDEKAFAAFASANFLYHFALNELFENK